MTHPSTARLAHRSEPLTAAERNQRRKLIFQDSLSLLALTVISVAIAVLTYYFFHSFSEHREVLEQRWYARGQQAMAAGNPQYAVEAFRSALSLSSDNTAYELSLAEALAAANRNDEAYAYFSSLHEAQPGDGFLNLQLARLEAKRKNSALAVQYYRSALTGLWYGHGAEQRFQIRLELAKYLMSHGEATQAQGDLLTAEGNSLDHPPELLEVANLLDQASDPSDAFTAYQRVERHAGARPALVLQALLGEASVAASMGQYKRAAQALDRYAARARQHPAAATLEQRRSVQQQLGRLQRLLQLVPFYALPPDQHAERVLLGAKIAHARYTACAAQLQPATASGPTISPANTPSTRTNARSAPANTPSAPTSSPSAAKIAPSDAAALAALGAQWDQLAPVKPKKLADNLPLQQTLMAWTSQTEILTSKLCGAPSGDNALLLRLARIPDKNE